MTGWDARLREPVTMISPSPRSSGAGVTGLPAFISSREMGAGSGRESMKQRDKKKGPPKRAFHRRSDGCLPASAATATAATRTEATATARTTTATRTAAAAGAAGAILRFVDAQLAAAHREAVQGLDGLRGLGLRHFDEAETTRTAGLTVRRQRHGLDRAVLREEVAHLGFGRRERQVSNINLHDSRSLTFLQNMAVRGPLTRVGDGHSQRQDSRSGSSGRANELGRANLRSAGPVTLTEPGAAVGAENSTGGGGLPFRVGRKTVHYPLFWRGRLLFRGDSPLWRKVWSASKAAEPKGTVP